jgi:AcrR family transcriptional regulator
MARVDSRLGYAVAVARKPATSPRKLPKQERSKFLVEAILDATSRVLVRDGYDDTTTTRVAEAAGVTIGSLYQYFPSKEALVAALVDRHLASITATLDSLVPLAATTPLPDVVAMFVRAHLALHAVDPALHRALLEKVPALDRRASTIATRTAVAIRIRALLMLHRIPGDLDLISFLLVGLMDGLVQTAILDRPDLLSSPTFATELTSLITRYLRLA